MFTRIVNSAPVTEILPETEPATEPNENLSFLFVRIVIEFVFKFLTSK